MTIGSEGLSLEKDQSSSEETGPVDSGKGNTVRRGQPKCSGVYVKGYVNHVPVWMTVDTGASKTIVSSRVFGKIRGDQKPNIQKRECIPLEQADGNPLGVDGTAELTLQLGTHIFASRETVVADIKDDVLLGMDMGHTTDVITSKGLVKIDDREVPCTHIKSSRVYKVTSADTYHIEGNTEQEIDVYIESCPREIDAPTELLIEPSHNFTERYSMMMARSIVDVSACVTGKVRIMNPFDKRGIIRQDSVIGEAELMDKGTEVISCVDIEGRQETLDGPHGKPSEGLSVGTGMEVVNLQKPQAETDIQKTANTKDRVKKGHQHLSSETVVPVRYISATNSSIPEHLQEMYSRAVEGKTPADKQVIFNIVKHFADVFSKDDTDLGCTHLAVHEIPTGDATPVKQPPRRVPLALAHEEKEAIDNLKKQGVIRESSSPWASPIVLVRKKNGKIRPCVDYRRVNFLTRKDAYPIPRTQDCLDAMAGSVMFSTLDMTSGYHQIPIKEEDIPKTAFVTKQGLYEFTTMPFGLTNAPATFQRVMEIACRGLQWSRCLIYLDDVLIFGRTPEEHATRLKLVLERIRKAGLKLKPEKCELFQTEVRFLGHVVSAEGVQPDPTNTSKIRDWSVPKSVTEVRQFLGLCSYYRKFVKNFSIVAKPLSDLTCRESSLVWNTQCQEAFDELKAKLLGTEVTAFPLDDAPFILDTDACDTGIGAVLSQVQSGRERVVAYASRTLNRAERNYCITDKELLAVRYFVEYFRQYLLGREFCVRTDHQALKWLFQLKEPKGRIARWIEILSAYQFSIEYRPGKRHGNADGLSRCPNPRDCQCSDTDNLESLRCGPCSKCRKRSQEMQLVDMEDQLQVVRMAKANADGKLSDLNEEADKRLGLSPTAVRIHPLAH